MYGSGSLTVDEAHRFAVDAGGLVLPGQRGRHLARRLVRDRGFTGRVWLDAIRYLRRSEDGPAPRRPQQSLIDEWLLVQQDLRVAELLTAPDQVLAAGDLEALARLLNDDEWPVDSRVMLPLEAGWLSHHADRLCAEIDRAGRPVAVAFRDSFDPLASLPRVRGLVALADPARDIMLLRADCSAVGALAFGIRSAAVGVSTYTRHIPSPVPRRNGDLPPVPRGTDVYVPALGAHHRAATLQMMEAIGSAELRGLDTCGCGPCCGRSLTRLAYRVDLAAGRGHDVACLLKLGAALRAHTVSGRVDWWLRHCLTTWDAHQWLRRAKDVAVPLPKALAAWVRLGGPHNGVPVDQR